jgi:hypothetical protein
MKKIIKQLALLCLLSSAISAQLVPIKEPNMHSEAPIYRNNKGELYSTIITFKYVKKLANTSKWNSSIKENEILVDSFKDFLRILKKQYGEFAITKAVANVEWGDTLKINKRTKQIVKVPDLSQIYKINFSKPVAVDSVVSLIKTRSDIVFAEGPIIAYLTLTPNDPEYTVGSQWAYNVIKAEQAWDITTGSQNIRIGINDRFGEVYVTSELHEDLVGKVVWDNLNGNYGDHGTFVGGIAGAMTNNLLGIASLGWNLNLMLSKWDYANIKTLVDNGADVINFSWVSGYYEQLENAIRYALQMGVVCVASAGNTRFLCPLDCSY